MAATLSGAYTSAPDTPSPVFPDRLIRPLPKRRIRSRLSPEIAESILFPPAPPTSQLFYGAYSSTGDALNDSKVYVTRDGYPYEPSVEDDPNHPYEDGLESADEDGPVVVRRGVGIHGPSLPAADNGDVRQKFSKQGGLPPAKAASNAQDGYDAFENTNNKKKRKIPTSGGLGSHSSLSSDVGNLSCSSGSGISVDDGPGQYYGSGNPVPVGGGISGSGRGRYGRNAGRAVNGRNPLAAHSPNAWSTGRPGFGRRDSAPPFGQEHIDSVKGSDQGIISAAIANAAALSSSAPHGQESISLLDQTKKPTPAKTQFTFTCESDSSKGMAWQTGYVIPDHPRSSTQPLSAAMSAQRGFSTQGTQTSPNMAAQGNQQGHPGGQGVPGTAQPRKPRRSARSLYALAARQRRIQQQYTNLHHPPNVEDIWICEFCEYESIFGHPPEALIRQYEIKDRRERRRMAEKRRLLEKAKMKGRKGKKGNKNAAKNAAAQQSTPHQQGYDRPPAPDPSFAANYGVDVDYDEFGDGEIYHPQVPQPIPPKQPMISDTNDPNTKQTMGQTNKVPTGVGDAG